MPKKSLSDRLRDKQKAIKDKSSGFKYYVIKSGTNRFRVLPAGSEKDWSQEVITFFLSKELGMLISPASFGERCAFMEAYEKLSNSKKKSERAVAQRLKPGRKFFVAADKAKENSATLEQAPKPLLLTSGLIDEMIELYLDEADNGDFTHPRKGYDIKYTRTGEGKTNTRYGSRPCKPTKLPEDMQKKTWDIEEMVKKLVPTYKETKVLLDKFLNLDPEDTDDSYSSNSKKKKKKRKSDM